ncbi:hypothetical protein K2173_020371 [Erythroxylum novogranatense]|uniref:Methyltransferase-like protein 13 n=1 Tax=Erythroxylum novogranatense TaxID=1862640 RepID=A0AAV8TIL3_9ROSI|nr:hypothetical protein K2173_020371 [Erythroxylum novogranatense]
MGVDIQIFEALIPGRFISFNIPIPDHTNILRFAVLDSPIPPTGVPQVATLIVPKDRESDWIFCTESGNFQLLFSSPGVSRLILIGKVPLEDPASVFVRYKYDKDQDAQYRRDVGISVETFLFTLIPKVVDKAATIPLLDFADGVVSGVVLEVVVGARVGEMLVEDVELESVLEGSCINTTTKVREFMRRLRFKRMPNHVQTMVRIDSLKVGKKVPDVGVLAQQYCIAMVASLSVIEYCVEERIRLGSKPRALCLGVGGGTLLSFLRSKLGFEVEGAEMDEEVLRVGRKYFGLGDCETVKIHVGDAIEIVQKLASGNNEFEVIMVDLNAWEPWTGTGAPPVEFLSRESLWACRCLIRDYGILVMNVITQSKSSSSYRALVQDLGSVFDGLYEIDVGGEDNVVLIASTSTEPLPSPVADSHNSFRKKLRTVIAGEYLDSIKKIPCQS